MSSADKVRDALRGDLQAAYTPVISAGGDYAKAQKAVMGIDDVVDTMSAIVDLIVAAEKLEAMAAGAVKLARTALTRAIDETGAPEVLTMHHKAYLAHKAAFVAVEQPDLVPEGYWNDPTPNKAAIKKAIEAGEDVPGCTLIRPNEMSLVIRGRK